MKTLTKAMNIISNILDIDKNLDGKLYLKELVKNTAKYLEVKYAFIGHTIDKNLSKVATDVVWAGEDYGENFTYELKDSPCELVLSSKRVCIYDSNVCNDFPKDVLLKEMNIESYVGVPVLAKDKTIATSILVLLDEKPMEDREFFSVISEFIAVRAYTEIEKIRYEKQLKEEVEKRAKELLSSKDVIGDLKLEYSEEKFKLLFELSPLGMAMIDHESGAFIEVNQSLLSTTGYTKEEFLALSFWDITPRDYEKQEEEQFEELNRTGKFGPNEKEYIKKDGTRYPIKISGFSMIDTNGRKVVWGFIEDITTAKEYEVIYKDNKELLEKVAIENSLQKILDEIVYLSEKRNPETLCSILLLDEAKKHLLNGSAPSLPSFYNDAIHGVEIGEKVGSCGSAAFKKQRVIVENIDSHENWQPYLELTVEANLHSCWSQPILSSDNEVLGTFAIYNKKPKKPSEFELKLIESYANIASKAIEKHKYTKFIFESKQELEQLFNNSYSGLLYINEDRILIKANQRFADILGYDTPEELLGFSMEEFHLNQERYMDFGKKNFHSLIVDKENFNIEYELKRKDGSAIWCDLSGKALDNNTPADLSKGVLWTVNDIADRKNKEDELKELNHLADSLTKSQQVLLSLFDKGESILFRWKNDKERSVEYVSNSIVDLLGVEKSYFCNNEVSYENYIHIDDINRVKEENQKAIKSNKDYYRHEPYRIITRDGKEKWVLDNTATQKDAQGNITHLIGYITDITEQIENQEIMYQQSKIASLGEMLGNIAHQWRQPLSIISTTATGTKLKKELGSLEEDELVINMDNINAQAQYLSKTIDDFRNFFLKDSSANKKEVSIQELLRKVISLVKDSLVSSNIELIEKFQEDECLTYCNENLLLQALINIVNNARDALVSPRNSNLEEKYIFIELNHDKKSFQIDIKDNAGGIQNNIIDKIFEPYFTTKHKSQGTGLGLYMTNQIVTKHLNSKISVKNISYLHEERLEKGALFSISIENM